MKTNKEFFEKLKSDEEFAKEVGEKVMAKANAGNHDYIAIWTEVAGEYGYELSADELEERYNAAQAELSEEELGKVAGGTTPLTISVSVSILVLTSASASISYITRDMQDK